MELDIIRHKSSSYLCPVTWLLFVLIMLSQLLHIFIIHCLLRMQQIITMLDTQTWTTSPMGASPRWIPLWPLIGHMTCILASNWSHYCHQVSGLCLEWDCILLSILEWSGVTVSHFFICPKLNLGLISFRITWHISCLFKPRIHLVWV